MIDCGDLHDINATMGVGLDLEVSPDIGVSPERAAEVEAEIQAEERRYILRQYRCAALTGILASHSQVSPIGAVELACQLADLLLEREP